MKVTLQYGRSGLTVDLPSGVDVVSPPEVAGLPDLALGEMLEQAHQRGRIQARVVVVGIGAEAVAVALDGGQHQGVLIAGVVGHLRAELMRSPPFAQMSAAQEPSTQA